MSAPGDGRTIEQSGRSLVAEHMNLDAGFGRERANLPPLSHGRADLAATHLKFRPCTKPWPASNMEI